MNLSGIDWMMIAVLPMLKHFSNAEWALLQARAQRVAKAAAQEQTEALHTALVVEVNREQYALPIHMIAAVYKDVRVIPVPCTPTYIAGIANIRGHIIPVIDLARLLNGSGSVDTANSIVVVVSTAEWHVAFRVDALSDVIMYSPAHIVPLPGNLKIDLASCVSGLLPDNQILLDLER